MGRLTLFRNGLAELDFVETFFCFAALGYLIAAYTTCKRLPSRVPAVLALCTGVALAIEAAKLTVANQTYRGDNVVFALIGAAVEVALEFRVPYRSLFSRRTCSFQLF